jgi:hypothetical protein
VRKWIPSLFVIAAAVASLLAYSSMPERVPTHWNAAGEADGWSSRFAAAWMLPLVMAAMVVVFRILPHIDPKRANYEKFGGIYNALVSTILGFLLGVHVVVLMNAAGFALPSEELSWPQLADCSLSSDYCFLVHSRTGSLGSALPGRCRAILPGSERIALVALSSC